MIRTALRFTLGVVRGIIEGLAGLAATIAILNWLIHGHALPLW